MSKRNCIKNHSNSGFQVVQKSDQKWTKVINRTTVSRIQWSTTVPRILMVYNCAQNSDGLPFEYQTPNCPDSNVSEIWMFGFQIVAVVWQEEVNFWTKAEIHHSSNQSKGYPNSRHLNSRLIWIMELFIPPNLVYTDRQSHNLALATTTFQLKMS